MGKYFPCTVGMAVVLSAVNNASAVIAGAFTPHFTLRIRSLNTIGKHISLDTAQFELHSENVDTESNKLYVETQEGEVQLSILTGTHTDIADLITVINEALKSANHPDIVFSYSRYTSRASISVPVGKKIILKPDSPSVVLGLGSIAESVTIQPGLFTSPYAVDLTRGRRFVLLYTDLIAQAVEYEDNQDSRILKTFPIQTHNGINNYIFGERDKRALLPHSSVTEISFWLKYNTGEFITTGYPALLDLRIE